MSQESITIDPRAELQFLLHENAFLRNRCLVQEQRCLESAEIVARQVAEIDALRARLDARDVDAE